ncbi:MAG: nucleotide exchange factor GrpE [Pseudomonadota bacterium]
MSDEEATSPGGDGDALSNGDGASGGRMNDETGIDQRLASLEAERNEAKDRMLRIAAEFENWKKRARKEREDGEAKIRESVLRDMLDVVDNLERALGAHKPEGAGTGTGVDGPAVLKGVELVLRLFQSKLERYGAKVIAAVGQPFDPRVHEAISRVETSQVPAGHVTTELQRGYMIGDRLLRPSMVAVATPPVNKADETGAGGEGGGGEGESA